MTWLNFFELSGWKLYLYNSFIFSFIICSFVIVVGFLINKCGEWEVRLLTRLFNHKVAIFIYDRLMFVGVMIHELLYALLVILSGAKLKKIRLFEVSKGGTLGHVEFCPVGSKWSQLCQMSFILCAPVFVGIIIECILIRAVFICDINIWFSIFIWYIIVSIFNYTSMSDIDIKHYLKGMIVIIPSLTAIMFVCQFLFSKS